MSTANVPCQRRDWWARSVRQMVPVLYRLPLDIFDIIVDVSHLGRGALCKVDLYG